MSEFPTTRLVYKEDKLLHIRVDKVDKVDTLYTDAGFGDYLQGLMTTFKVDSSIIRRIGGIKK